MSKQIRFMVDDTDCGVAFDNLPNKLQFGASLFYQGQSITMLIYLAFSSLTKVPNFDLPSPLRSYSK
jgi:hypothetical protein